MSGPTYFTLLWLTIIIIITDVCVIRPIPAKNNVFEMCAEEDTELAQRRYSIEQVHECALLAEALALRWQ